MTSTYIYLGHQRLSSHHLTTNEFLRALASPLSSRRLWSLGYKWSGLVFLLCLGPLVLYVYRCGVARANEIILFISRVMFPIFHQSTIHGRGNKHVFHTVLSFQRLLLNNFPPQATLPIRHTILQKPVIKRNPL